MDFNTIVQDIRAQKLAACRFEEEGHHRFRDCVYIGRNGKIMFERYSYGEAASLVFGLRAKGIETDGTLLWDYGAISYSGKYEAPKQLTGYTDGALQFDGKPALWPVAARLKTLPQLGLGGVKMVFARLFG